MLNIFRKANFKGNFFFNICSRIFLFSWYISKWYLKHFIILCLSMGQLYRCQVYTVQAVQMYPVQAVQVYTVQRVPVFQLISKTTGWLLLSFLWNTGMKKPLWAIFYCRNEFFWCPNIHLMGKSEVLAYRCSINIGTLSIIQRRKLEDGQTIS